QGWRVLRAIGGAMDSDGFAFDTLDELRASMTETAPAGSNGQLAKRAERADASNNGLVCIISTGIYRGDAVLRRAPALNEHPLSCGPTAFLHCSDASRLGFEQGGKVCINGQTLTVALASEVPPGCVWIQSGYPQTDALPPYGASLTMTGA
ncbi:MAG: NADH-quinone oxidoreductase subunit G, partial [Dokdonella sp.]